MKTKKDLSKFLRDNDAFTRTDKHVYSVRPYSNGDTATVIATKSGLYIGGERTIPFALCKLFVQVLIGPTHTNNIWSKKDHKKHSAILALLYGHRTLRVVKSDPPYSFTIDDKKNPSIVHLSENGTVTLFWANDNKNVYDYADTLKDLVSYGQNSVTSAGGYSASTTMEEIEANPKLMKKLLGPAYPAPPTISNEAMRANEESTGDVITTSKQYWHDPVQNIVRVSNKGTALSDIGEQYTEVSRLRYKELIERQGATLHSMGQPAESEKPGGAGPSLSAKKLRKLQKQLKKISGTKKQIRHALAFGASDGTISDLLEVDCATVAKQRVKLERSG